MLHRYFNASYPLQYIFLVVLTMVWWFPSVLSVGETAAVRVPHLPVGVVFQEWIIPGSIADRIIILPGILLTALLTNMLLQEQGLIPRSSLLGAFYTLLFMMTTPSGAFTSISVISAISITGILFLAISSAKQKLHGSALFYAGMLAGMLYLINPVFIFTLLWLIIFFVIFRAGSWRDWLLPLAGLLTTVYLTLSLIYLTDRYDLITDIRQHLLPDFTFSKPVHGTLKFWLPPAVAFITMLWAIGVMLKHYGEHILIIRKTIVALVWLAGIATLPFLPATGLHPDAALWIPAGLLTAAGASETKRNLTIEVITWLLLMSVLIFSWF
ncbi:MAG: hypothetical protein Kow00127_24110 [Bacteroidales bacterium]